MFTLNDLNPEQQIAADTISGPVLILAGAGTGKTRTLIYRISNMILHKGISPESILGISFTNKAANELKERLQKILKKSRHRYQLTNLKQKKESLLFPRISTFHSLGLWILKNDIENLGYHKNFGLFDQSDQLSLVRQIIKNFKTDKVFDTARILSKIGLLKNQGISPEDFSDSVMFDGDEPYDHVVHFVYHQYQEKLFFMNVIDFDDILCLSLKLLNQFPTLAEKYSQTFQYIMVDEYQDTNPLQFAFIQKLTFSHKNICVVGDDDQSIYSFRGADVSNILEFEKFFPKARVIKLERNYRSQAPILSLANQVICENQNRMAKTLISHKSSMENNHELPEIWAMGDTDHEAQVVAEEIEK
jgi:DNA helicase II / ATP-dependent DNA helicase PcrA